MRLYLTGLLGQNKKNMISISVVVPTMGRIQFLDIAIKSLLDQELRFEEILILDNSKEQNLQSQSFYGLNNSVRWEKSGSHLNAIDSWNTAVSMARNEYVTLFGDDDIALSHFHCEMQSLIKRSDFGLLPFERIDENGRKDGVVSGVYKDLSPHEFRYKKIKGEINTVVPGVIFKRDKFFMVGGFVDVGVPNYLFLDDFLWFKMALLENKVAISHKSCWFYRKHRQSLGGLNTIGEFSKRIPKYINAMALDLIHRGVEGTKVFPPDFSCQQYIDRVQSGWFNFVITKNLKMKTFSSTTYLREVYFYLRCEATVKSKAKCFIRLFRDITLNGTRYLFRQVKGNV